MNHKLTTSVALLISSLANSQEFSGVKITGPLDSFTAKLQLSGYKLIEKNDREAILEGKDEMVMAIATVTSRQTYKITTFLPKHKTWSELRSEYFMRVAILMAQYGDPTHSVSKFIEPYKDGDGKELEAVNNNKCSFTSYWVNKIPNTTIAIAIAPSKRVVITIENNQLVLLNVSEK